MARRREHQRYAVDGTESSYADLGPALSRAITAATKAADETTVYVRDWDETIVGRVERDENGVLRVYRL